MAAAKKPRVRRPRQAPAEAVVEEPYVPKVIVTRAGVPDRELSIEEILWQIEPGRNPLYYPTDEEQALVTEHFEALAIAEAEAEAARLAAQAIEQAGQAAAEEEAEVALLDEVLESAVEA